MADDNDDGLVFCTNPMWRGRTVRRRLGEVGRPCRTEPLDHGPAMKRPAFERYQERVGARPAALRAKAIDDAPIAGREHAPPPA